MSKERQQAAAFGFGVVFVIALIILAIIFPTPTPFQYTVFRVVLALAAAGIAVMIPGFLEVRIPTWIRAGGALGVFVVVYFFNPAQLVVQETMDVSPRTDQTITGEKAGPFEPAFATYRISVASGTIDWKATANVDWVTIDPANGKVAAGSPVSLTVKINPKTTALRIGPHIADLTFTNQTNRSGDTIRRVELRVTGGRFIESSVLPIRDQYLPRLHQSIDRLILRLKSDFTEKISRQDIPWSIAQIVVSLKGKLELDPADVAAFMTSKVDPLLHAWRQFPEDANDPIHLGATAWVILSLARVGRAAGDDQIQFLLQRQSVDGWWPIYPTNARAENASIYSTALSLLALKEQSKQNLISEKMQPAVKSAIDKGAAWLLNSRSNTARWKNYPARREFGESISASALALHTLHHVVDEKDLVEMDRAWVKTLPQSIPAASDYDQSLNATIEIGPGRTDKDKVRLFKLPWMIIASVDAYPNLFDEERALAFDWVDAYLSERSELDQAVSTDGNWIAAELLMALRDLAGENMFR
jgi:hypothetical protein